MGIHTIEIYRKIDKLSFDKALNDCYNYAKSNKLALFPKEYNGLITKHTWTFPIRKRGVQLNFTKTEGINKKGAQFVKYSFVSRINLAVLVGESVRPFMNPICY